MAVGGRVCRRKGMWGEEAGRSPPARVEGDQGTEVGKERKGEATWWQVKVGWRKGGCAKSSILIPRCVAMPSATPGCRTRVTAPLGSGGRCARAERKEAGDGVMGADSIQALIYAGAAAHASCS